VLAPLLSDSSDSESEDDASSVKSSPHRREYDAKSDTTHEDNDAEAVFEAAMERVRLRKENNQMLVPVAAVSSSTPTAAIDSGIDVSSVDQPRRTTRAAAGVKKAGPATTSKAKSSADLSFLDVKAIGAKGQFGLAAIVRERQEKARSGKSSAWLQSKQLLEEDDSDLDRVSLIRGQSDITC
jgi:hypothetical protein